MTPKAPSSFPPRETSEEEIRARLKRTYPSSYHHDSFSVRCVIELICWERDNYPHQSLLSAEREAGRKEAFEEAAKEAEAWWDLFDFDSFAHTDLRRTANPNQIAARIRTIAKAPAAGKERG